MRHRRIAVVTLLGPDGSGKSTLATMMQGELQEHGVKASRQHWRPNVLPSRGGRLGPADCAAIRENEPRGRLASCLWLIAYWLDFALGSCAWYGPGRRTVLIAERYFYDVLIDPRRYRLRMLKGIMSALSCLVPKPDLCILLEGSAEVIASRKRELSVDEVRAQIDRLQGVRRFLPASRVMTLETTAASPSEQVRVILSALVDRGFIAPRVESRSD